jgi:hypothetical protein
MESSNKAVSQGGWATLARMYWMMVAPGALLVVLAAIFRGQHAGSWLLHGVYWLLIASLLLVRYVDIFKFHGETTDGTPATVSHFRRYALMLAVLAPLLWLAAWLPGMR